MVSAEGSDQGHHFDRMAQNCNSLSMSVEVLKLGGGTHDEWWSWSSSSISAKEYSLAAVPSVDWKGKCSPLSRARGVHPRLGKRDSTTAQKW